MPTGATDLLGAIGRNAIFAVAAATARAMIRGETSESVFLYRFSREIRLCPKNGKFLDLGLLVFNMSPTTSQIFTPGIGQVHDVASDEGKT